MSARRKALSAILFFWFEEDDNDDASTHSHKMDSLCLVTSDQQRVHVSRAVFCKYSRMMEGLFGLGAFGSGAAAAEGDDSTIPLDFISSATLALILDFIKHHETVEPLPAHSPLASAVETEHLEELVPPWHAAWAKHLSHEQVYYVHYAASFLDIPYLVDLLSARVMCELVNKTHLQIRAAFGIASDFTPAEEEIIALENKWLAKMGRGL